MYLVGRSCFYQGKITLKGVEWREKEVERERGKSERNYRGRERIREREALLEERME